MNDKEFIKVLRKQKEKIQVPDSLKPENIDKLLENADDKVVSMDVKKASKKKLSNVKKAFLIAASVAAVLVMYLGISNYIRVQRLSTEYFTEVKDGFSVLKSYDKLSGYLVATKEEETRYKMSDFWEDFKNGELFAKKKSSSIKNSETVTLAPPSDSYSKTNVRTEGVDEPDIIKTNGKYIYSLNYNYLYIFRPDGKNTELIEKVELSSYWDVGVGDEMLLYEDLIIIIGARNNKTMLLVLNFEDETIKEMEKFTVDGKYSEARMSGEYVYLCTKYSFSDYDVESVTPKINEDSLDPSKVYIVDSKSYKEYCIISSFSLGKECELVDYAAVINDGSLTSYVSTENYYMMSEGIELDTYKYETDIIKFSYDEGIVEPIAKTTVEGYLADIFCIDEYDGYLRAVFTHRDYNYTNSLYVMDENLDICGKIENIAPGERVYSARFQGDVAYFVTFKEVDPLFSVDLSNPKNPKIIGALKIPGFSEYMHIWDENHLFGFGCDDISLKLSMFDIKDPRNVFEADKLVIKGLDYSDALYEHRALFIEPEKNIIGFGAEGENPYDNDKSLYGYFIYAYEDGEFVQKLHIPMQSEGNYLNEKCRGLYVGEYIYIVTNASDVYVVNMEDYEVIAYVYGNNHSTTIIR